MANLAALGAMVVPVGWIGTDLSGDELVTTTGPPDATRTPWSATLAPERPKTRIVAGGRHGGVLDAAPPPRRPAGHGAPDAAAEDDLVQRIEHLAVGYDGFVLSDYGTVLLHGRSAGTVMRLAENRYVGLDSRHRLLDYTGVSAATPNLEDGRRGLGAWGRNEAGIRGGRDTFAHRTWGRGL